VDQLIAKATIEEINDQVSLELYVFNEVDHNQGYNTLGLPILFCKAKLG
jgi:hypothetical protein